MHATHERPCASSRPGRLSSLPGRRVCARSRSFVYLVAVFLTDPVVRWLWPIPVALFVVYPYLKRVTWLCHVWLGVCARG